MQVNDIKTIAMFGAGTIGGGFAAYFALKGLDVRVYEISEEAIEKSSKPNIKQAVDTYVKYGITDKPQEIWDRISFFTDPEKAFTGVYFVQECGPERMEIKHSMIETMEKYLPEDAIIASSSSGMSVTLIADGAKHPERILVAHPFNPSYLLPLMEICGGDKTSPETIALAKEFYKKYDKAPVILNKEKKGFIANRLMHALWREEIALVTEGVCTMEDCDNAWTFGPGIRLAAFGPAMNYELGGGDLGLRGCALKFGAMTDAVFEDISAMKKVPDTWADLSGDAIGPLMADFQEPIGNTKEEIADFRDRLIVNVLKMHERM